MVPVALLIPVFRDQKGLELSLSTLPTEIPLDVMVVDDGSDPPIVAPKTIGPHKVLLLRMEKNRGAEHASNYGLELILARGYKYVAHLDAGDVALPGRFAKQIEFLEAHPEIGLLGGQARYLDMDGREIFRSYVPVHHEAIYRAMHVRNCFAHSAVMLRTELLREIGLYSSDFQTAEDYELFFRFTLRSRVANLSEFILHYYVNPKGISLSRRHRQIQSTLKIQRLYFDPRLSESYRGILKSLVLLLIPGRISFGMKLIIGKLYRRNLHQKD